MVQVVNSNIMKQAKGKYKLHNIPLGFLLS